MNEPVLFTLLFFAIGIGWFLGRRSRQDSSSPGFPGHYYRGLNYLLESPPDGEVDAFIDSLPVNSETLETHIALGSLMRRKGEVEAGDKNPSEPPGATHIAR